MGIVLQKLTGEVSGEKLFAGVIARIRSNSIHEPGSDRVPGSKLSSLNAHRKTGIARAVRDPD